jgi:transposase
VSLTASARPNGEGPADARTGARPVPLGWGSCGELTRRRRTLVRERAQEANRLHKALENTGIKLDCVATDIFGVSGRLMLAALLAGERDPTALAGLAKGRLCVKRSALVEAFEGCRFGEQNTLLIGGILRHVDFLDAEIAALGEAIEAHLQSDRQHDDQSGPFELAVQLACSLDGIQKRTAQMLIGEFGTDMSRFPSDAHFASWAAQCPGNHQSAGKRRSGKTRKGPRWLDGALHDAAMGAIPSRTATSPESTGGSRRAPGARSRSVRSNTQS